ncbi:MAG: LTA synthase family protein [bacterium]
MKKYYPFILFLIIIFTKILIFSKFNWIWPTNDILLTFIIYNLLATAILLSPALFLYKQQIKYLFFIDIFVSFVLIIDSVYLSYFSTLPVVSLMGSTGQLTDLIPSLVKLLSPIEIFYVADFIIIIGLKLFFKKRFVLDAVLLGKDKIGYKKALLFIVIILLSLTALLAYDSKDKLPRLYNLIGENKLIAKNLGVFGAHIVDISRNFVDIFNTLSPEQKTEALNKLSTYTVKPIPNNFTGVAKGKKVIMIQVEALNNFFVGAKANGQEITPNLNKLAANSKYFTEHIFTLGAGSTSDADFSTNTSIYPLLDSSTFVKYGNDDFTSLEKELKKVGYLTNAYHANSRGYWNRTTAFKSLGFDNFYAQENYKKGENISMGLEDKSFFEQSLNYITKEPAKSFDYLITLSSHYAFEMPVKYQKLNLESDQFTTLDANFLQSINYADSSLGAFIDGLKRDKIYDDSLIVVYGDHTAKYDPMTLDGVKIDPETEIGKRVPLIIKLPNQVNGEIISKPSSHLDIMPTILNLVGVSATSPMFGRDLFGENKPQYYTSSFVSNFESIVMDGYKYLSNGVSSTCNNISDNTSVDVAKCDGISKKRDDIQNTVNNLIKHNLFNDYLKQ